MKWKRFFRFFREKVYTPMGMLGWTSWGMINAFTFLDYYGWVFWFATVIMYIAVVNFFIQVVERPK